MKGCLWLHSTTIKQKQALTVSNLSKVILNLANSKEHNDFLFQALLLTGFFALMHLGELTFHNDISHRNWKKVTKCSTVIVSADQHEFHLPSHKADPFFEGNHIIIKKRQYCNINPLAAFTTYLHSHDQNSHCPLLYGSHLQGPFPHINFSLVDFGIISSTTSLDNP